VRRLVRTFTVSLGILVGVTSCRGSDDSSVTGRLWVSALPRSPRVPVRSFITTKAAKDHAGILIQGSLYRGGYDVFTWKNEADGRVALQYLQDQRRHTLTIEPCTPSRGFHACIDVAGEPTIAGRYQSRKRWVLRRGQGEGDALDVPTLAAAWASLQPDVTEALRESDR